jgi:hypothetical protein
MDVSLKYDCLHLFDRDVDAQAFDKSPLSIFLKRDHAYSEILGEFRTDLSACANLILAENVLCVDIPSQKFDFVKAHVQVFFSFFFLPTHYFVCR